MNEYPGTVLSGTARSFSRRGGLGRISLLAVLVLLGVTAVTKSFSRPTPIPVIFDTDIGGDVDDAWALSFLLASPEVDVKLIVSDSHDTVKKAKLISEFLRAAGRVDIPIGIGLNGAKADGSQETWIRSYRGTVRKDGVQAIIDTIMNSKRRITLLATGPVPNLELALEREPRIVEHARLVVMGGSIGRQEQGGPGFPEYNVASNPKAARKVYGAGWDVTMAPTDTAGKVQLQGKDYALVRDAQNPLARLVMEQYYAWNRRQTKYARDVTRTSSTLWDTVAVYLTFDHKYCRMRDIRLRVTDKGITKPTADGKLTHVAIQWKDLASFEKLLASRIAHFKPHPVHNHIYER